MSLSEQIRRILHCSGGLTLKEIHEKILESGCDMHVQGYSVAAYVSQAVNALKQNGTITHKDKKYYLVADTRYAPDNPKALVFANAIHSMSKGIAAMEAKPRHGEYQLNFCVLPILHEVKKKLLLLKEGIDVKVDDFDDLWKGDV